MTGTILVRVLLAAAVLAAPLTVSADDTAASAGRPQPQQWQYADKSLLSAEPTTPTESREQRADDRREQRDTTTFSNPLLSKISVYGI